MKVLLLLAVASPVLAQTCTFTPQFSSFTLGSGGFSNHFQVAVSLPSCPWTATSNVPWITVLNSPFVGSASLSYQIDANATTQVRTGTITLGNQTTQATVSFTQLAGNCNYQVTPPISASYPVGGGSGTFQVTSGCNWYPSPSDSFVTLTGSTSQVLGNGSVSYTVAPNTCVAPRTSTVVVVTGANLPPPPVYTITVAGSDANLSLGSASASFGPAAAVGRVVVNTGNNCNWSAFSDATWLQITGGSNNGFGPGAVTFSMTQNSGPSRTGSIHVGTQTFTVTQTGTAPAGPSLTAIINAASGASGPIAPGEIISLFGANMGPVQGVAFNQTISFSLGNPSVQVMFGSLPAPLTYVSATQINAIVPYGVAGSASVPVQVQYQGQTSNSLTVAVQAATPAIFSADFSGHGPGAILNANFGLNSNTTPAAIGSAVMIYATGGGVTNPASADASFAPSVEPFARLVASVTVTIGGLPAQVLYAGGAPGLVSGLTQINAVVPAGVTPGPSVPVVIQIGGVPSQSGLTMAVQ